MLGKIVEENVWNWDMKVQFINAAYRASVHDTTGYTINLALGMEVREPMDVVLGPLTEETGYERILSLTSKSA